MKHHPFPQDVQRVVFAGDWHSNTFWAVEAIKRAAKEHNADVIVHLGDYGYRFPDEYLDAQQEVLEDHDLILMFVAGNHDDYDFLNSVPVSEDGVQRLRERIWCLPRGVRWEWGGVSFLGLGGAYSIDRSARMLGFSWWEEETLSDIDAIHAVSGGEVDVMVTHDAPLTSHIKKLQSDWLPSDVVAASDQHRALLGSVVDVVSPSYLFHGHYHQRYTDVIELEDGTECTVEGYDCDGGSFSDNLGLVTIDELKKGLKF